MLLTSPQLPSEKVKEFSFSNENCEMLIVEIPTLSTTCITLYRPPAGKNFSLAKVLSVIGKTGHLHVSNVLCEVDEEDVQERTENRARPGSFL